MGSAGISRKVAVIAQEMKAIWGAAIAAYPATTFGSFIRAAYIREVMHVKLGGNAIIAPHVVLNGSRVEIGHHFSTGPYVTIDPNDSFGILIGDNVGIASGTFVRAGNHRFDDPDRPFKDQGHYARKIRDAAGREASVIIEDDVWIGGNCVILSGALIGRGSVISAGSVVGHRIPPFSIAVGNPARPIASRRGGSFSKKYPKFSEGKLVE